jgi:hypothetical protein
MSVQFTNTDSKVFAGIDSGFFVSSNNAESFSVRMEIPEHAEFRQL